MGAFHVDVEIVNVRRPDRAAAVAQALVDTSFEFTWAPAALLRKAGVKIMKKDVPFTMANGQTITRSTGYAIVRASGFETVDEVVFGLEGDLPILGSRTLEGFGANVEPRRKRLVAAGPHVAA